jgi:hypothetical protein
VPQAPSGHAKRHKLHQRRVERLGGDGGGAVGAHQRAASGHGHVAESLRLQVTHHGLRLFIGRPILGVELFRRQHHAIRGTTGAGLLAQKVLQSIAVAQVETHHHMQRQVVCRRCGGDARLQRQCVALCGDPVGSLGIEADTGEQKARDKKGDT